MRGGYTLWQIAAMRLLLALDWSPSVARALARDAEARAHEFIDDAKALLVVGACADGAPPRGVKPEIVDAHCKKVRTVAGRLQDELARSRARGSSRRTCPKTCRRRSSIRSPAAICRPRSRSIPTPTRSRRCRSSPRAIRARSASSPTRSSRRRSQVVEKELGVALSRELLGHDEHDRRDARRSAADAADLQPVGAHDSRLRADVAALLQARPRRRHPLPHRRRPRERSTRSRTPASATASSSNIELKFRKPGRTHEQTYRHIMANLDDAHLKADPRALKHLEKKGNVAAMTKAASYLLSFGEFSTMRKYVIDHVDWMVSRHDRPAAEVRHAGGLRVRDLRHVRRSRT